MSRKLELLSRFFEPPQDSFFLFGPRGTGKSTWAGQAFEHALKLDLLQPDLFRSLSARPERLRELVEGNPDKTEVVVDEIQKIPSLLTVVHSLIEEKKPRRFVLTGSSARKLRRTGVDLLAGRARNCSLHPFMAAELKDRFDFARALRYGLLPLMWAVEEPASALEAYVALYLKEEVQAEGLVRNLGNFSRFLEVISFSHATCLNISNVSRECEIERKVVEGYIEILEDLLLAFRVPVFSKRAKRAVAMHPKFYLFDAGVFQTLRPRGPLDRVEEIGGAALEGLVAQHLRAWIAYGRSDHQLYFWRTRSGQEVDFILYGPNVFWAIEVKNTDRVRSEGLRALRAFQDDYPACKALFLYRGKERIKQHGILCVPCEEFLQCLEPGKNILT